MKSNKYRVLAIYGAWNSEWIKVVILDIINVPVSGLLGRQDASCQLRIIRVASSALLFLVPASSSLATLHHHHHPQHQNHN
jgi:hypothetical protein